MKEVPLSKEKIGKKFISNAGWGIGLASLLIAVYAEFIKKDAPRLEYDIVSSTNFINNRETSASLRIFVDSLDIQKNHLNISAVNIKVENKGTANIRYDDYDRGVFGLSINNAQLLEPPVLVDASTDHIKTLFSKIDSLNNDTFVEIPNISLDIDDYYIVRLVLLHNDNTVPSFIPEGKVVGQKEILLNTLQAPSPSFWDMVTSGNWLVHVVRFFLYFILILLLALIIAFTASQIDELVGKRKRRKHISKLSQKKRLDERVANDYIELGDYIIRRMYEIYNKDASELSTKYKKSKGFVNSKRALEKNNHRALMFHKGRFQSIQRMIDKGYLFLGEDDVITFNQYAKQSVIAIYDMLASMDLLKEPEAHTFYYDVGSTDSLFDNFIY